mmetsp:Transcript_148948/g.478619  ORF Transcript_148948/g.478619 Transcript_148948/m.478619 type:complete len:284 (-) Transcript_148948:223-1074(-)
MLATSTADRLPDPHSVSATLDVVTSRAIIERLEARGRDDVFRNTFLSYFPELHRCERVLEVGCGTGVVARALAADPAFRGRVHGVDQSDMFIGVARELADAEGVGDRVQFLKGDASDIGASGSSSYDAIIMHTLLSHVEDPSKVLASARSLAQGGSTKLIVMDGDYGSLTYAHQDDPTFGRSMDVALKDATFAQPDVMRNLPALLASTGWTLEASSANCVSEVGASASYWVSFAQAYMPRVKSSGMIDAANVDAWWDCQQRSIASGTFFAHAVYYTMIARASL